MDKKIAYVVLRYRTLFLVIITALTVFFGWRALHLQLSYDFEKLLPRSHPYVKTYKEFQETFGGANLITIEVAVKQGDIFDYETLNKIRRITDEIQFVRGIDRYKVISIGAKKIKETKATAWGLEKSPLLWPEVPQAPEKIQDLRRACMSDDSIYGILVSVDGKAALIMADVYEKGVDYQQIYREIRKITDREVGPNTTVHVCGEPIVVGEVIKAMPKIIWIFGISMVLVLGILYLHFMNLRIPFLHITVSGATTLWGLGMMEILHFTLNPMTTMVPFLLMVISISHANQLIIRYVEKSALLGQGGIEAAEAALGEILKPGVAALGTNLAGFSVLAIIPIGAIQELAVTASIGMCCAVIRDLTLLPILLSRMKNLGAHQNDNHFVGGLIEKAMTRISHSIFNRTERMVSLGIMVVLFGSGLYFARHMDIGNLHPGSPLFWEKSRYNLDSKKINEDFYGTDAMSVVIQGEKGVLREPALLAWMESYQRFITGIPKVGGAISLVDIVKNINQKVHEDDPVWFVIPSTAREVGGAYQLFYNGADPGDFEIFGTGELESANIRVFFKDHTASTIRVALDETKQFFTRNPPPAKAQVRLAGGLIGVLGAIGEVLEKYHLEATLLSFAVICVVVFLTFRSAMAVALICVPLGMVSVMSFAFMKLCRIELDINTLPIAALGMGLCVDYGIYLYGKIRSETVRGGNFREVLDRAMVSCGSAVIVTGTTFTLGVILWVFSDLRFQATMGVLLAFLFIMNMITSILVLPILIDIVKPKDIFASLTERNPEPSACRSVGGLVDENDLVASGAMQAVREDNPRPK